MAQSLKNIIASIPEAELRSFLLELAAKDSAVQNQIRVRYSQVGTKDLERIIETEIASLVRSCSDDDDFISYRKAADFEMGLETIMEQYIDPLLSDQATVADAIPLIGMVFDTLDDVDMDDDGETRELLDACMFRWEEVLNHASAQEHEQLAGWFENHLNSIYFTGLQEELFYFYTCHFSGRPFVRQRYEDLDKGIRLTLSLLESLEQQRNTINKKTPAKQIREINSAYQFRFDEYERLVQERYSLMNRCSASAQEKEQYLLSQPRSETAQDNLLELYKSNQQYDLAIQLLLNRKKHASDDWKDESWSRDLIGLYRAAGDTKHYLAELRSYVHTTRQYGAEYILLLRAVLSHTEWDAERDRLLGMKNVSVQARAEIYSEEKMLDELMALLESENDFHLLHTYEQQLFGKYAARLLPLRLMELNRLVNSSADRTTYAHLAGLLTQLTQYPNGKEIAAKLVADWKIKYHRRTAMLDELSKAGFR